MNFATNKLLTFDDRVTEKINEILKDKSKLYKLYIANGRKIGIYEKLLNMTDNITTEIFNGKKIYFDNLAEKIIDLKLN